MDIWANHKDPPDLTVNGSLEVEPFNIRLVNLSGWLGMNLCFNIPPVPCNVNLPCSQDRSLDLFNRLMAEASDDTSVRIPAKPRRFCQLTIALCDLN